MIILNIDGPLLSWIYFHGQLEHKCGTDLACGEQIPPLGVSEVKVADAACLAFIWKAGYRVVGLITLKKDHRACNHAYRQYLNRVKSL